MLLGETPKEPVDEQSETEQEAPVATSNEGELLDTALPEPPESPQPTGEPVVVYVKNAEQESA